MSTQSPHGPGHLVSVRFQVTFGVAAALVVLATTGLHWWLSGKPTETLTFFAIACAAAGQLAVALYTARLLQFTVATQTVASDAVALSEAKRDAAQLDQSAFRFAERWTDASMFHLRKECQEVIDNRDRPADILKSIQADKNKEANVSNILNFLEEMALAVNRTRCSEPIAKDLFCGIVINIWHATSQYAEHERRRRGRGQLWNELEFLYGRWNR